MKHPKEENPKWLDLILDGIERVGNKLPDPAALFLIGLIATWLISWFLGGYTFEIPSASGPIEKSVVNLLSLEEFITFLTKIVPTFTGFHPLGVVMTAVLGVGIAEKSGFIHAAIKMLLKFTPQMFLTPIIILVGVISHTAADVGYVLVIPLGGVIFASAGRHPLAGIAAAFAGVSGGFGANLIPSAIDPLLQGLTQAAANIIDPEKVVNPLCNWWFTAASSLLVIFTGWWVTDSIIEKHLEHTHVDEDQDLEDLGTLLGREKVGLAAGFAVMVGGFALLTWLAIPENSPLRDPSGSLTGFAAPLMQMIVPLIFLLFLFPGLVHGYIAGTFKSHRDVIKGMAETFETMAYYLVMAFFAAQFIYAFSQSQIGALIAVKGAQWLKSMQMSGASTLIGTTFFCALINLFVGSASAKWALLAPIFVPMLMQLGISPEMTQAAYRVGDSTTNIISPLLPYFPLVIAFGRKYASRLGLGTMISLMIPYSFVFFIAWTLLMLVFWTFGIPLGINGELTYQFGN